MRPMDSAMAVTLWSFSKGGIREVSVFKGALRDDEKVNRTYCVVPLFEHVSLLPDHLFIKRQYHRYLASFPFSRRLSLSVPLHTVHFHALLPGDVPLPLSPSPRESRPPV